jgi:hypothetical protein
MFLFKVIMKLTYSLLLHSNDSSKGTEFDNTNESNRNNDLGLENNNQQVLGFLELMLLAPCSCGW